MIVVRTRNSVYEVDPDGMLARYVDGASEPTSNLAPVGEWKTITGFSEVDHPAGGSMLYLTFAHDSYTLTSRIESVQYAPEPFEVSS